MKDATKSYSGNDWREDLKKIMLQVGVATKSTVFLFADNQIKDESFVEDINMLLNTGDVPNIFPADEKADIVSANFCGRIKGVKYRFAIQGGTWDFPGDTGNFGVPLE